MFIVIPMYFAEIYSWNSKHPEYYPTLIGIAFEFYPMPSRLPFAYVKRTHPRDIVIPL
jgi:hypothetical protein